MADNVSIDFREFLQLYRRLYSFFRESWDRERVASLRDIRRKYLPMDMQRLLNEMKMAVIVIDEIGLKQPTVCAAILYWTVWKHGVGMSEIRKLFGTEVELLLKGLLNVNRYSDKKGAVESENYIKLLLSTAEDIRVVFIMIARQLQLMRDA